MLPQPLHPAVVHFPIVLAFLLPVFAAGAIWAIRRGARPLRAWSIPMAMAGLLAVSSWAALATGESQEDRIESVVPDQALDAHEEAAEAFIAGAVGLLLIMAIGLLPGRTGTVARVVGALGAVSLVVGAAFVGHSGGQLVYQHGAASAYTSDASGRTAAAAAQRGNSAADRATDEEDR